MEKILIDIWADIACPYCYIGKHYLEQALSSLPANEQKLFKIVLHSYQLDPERPSQSTTNINQHLLTYRGMTVQQLDDMKKRLNNYATSAGIHFNFDTALVANTFKAHQLIQYAQEHGKAEQAEEELFEAYFSSGIDIGDVENLSLIAQKIGLNRTPIEFFSQDKYKVLVENDIANAQKVGVSGVPYFQFDKSIAVKGLSSVESFTEILKGCVLKNKNSNFTETAFQGQACSLDGGCH
ncbi:MAG: hypothetical protein AUK44_00880 [Porphyromonadaceae bacterium CG2_30_38_12]|nr:MAG: hypothetical protein AUK44_00880 [Porphyromonadaceae bacterium CG2_30_38_12]